MSSEVLEKSISCDPEKKKPYQCLICESNFVRKKRLKIHVMSVHKNKKSPKCPFCDLTTSSNYRLKSHISAVHEKN